MSTELYHRFTEIYLPGQADIKENELFSGLINKKLKEFAEKNEITSYRIVNCETQLIPSYPQGSSSDLKMGYVMLNVHIAYII